MGNYRTEFTHQNFEKSQINEEKVAATHMENEIV